MTRLGDAALVTAWAAVTDESSATPAGPAAPRDTTDPLGPLLDLVDADTSTAAGRDAAAVRLLHALAGGRLQGETTCPDCAARLDVDLDVPPVGDGPAPASARVEVEVGGRVRMLRQPTRADVDRALATAGDEDAGLRTLAASLLEPPDQPQLAATPDPAASIDEEALRTIDAAVAAMAGAAAVAPVELDCPACEAVWTADVALEQFLATTVDDRVRRVLDEVHDLARAYGWTPETVLALPRRVRDHHLARIR